ncbi:hypothetical protein LY76DRAFT_673081, partial [Colletotrichum caudatum]
GMFLGKQCPFPPLEDIKDFFRFYILMAKGRITNNKRPTLDSMLCTAEFFFAGFKTYTDVEVSKDDRSEVYTWLKRVVCEEEGLIHNVHKMKFNFTKKELDRVMRGLLTRADLKFMHERTRIQAAYIIPTYCWSGARISAFFTGGLCYRDIHVDIKRFDNGEIKPVYRLDQRWVKNNRDPENVVFGVSGEGDTTLLYNEITFLLNLALADSALEGISTWDDIHQIRIPEGKTHVSLSWKDDVLLLPVLRKVKDGVVTEEPMTKREFQDIWKALLLGEGFHGHGGIHMVRRGLGKQLEERYKDTIRSQHITHSDTQVYGRDYLANMSSANGKAAFLDLPANHEAVEHFQGLERSREEGLPHKLPAEREAAISRSPDVLKLLFQLDNCTSDQEKALIERERKNLLKRLHREELREYQVQWVQNRRREIISKKGQINLGDSYEHHILIDLVPERKRIAELASLAGGLTESQLREAEQAIYNLCVKDLTVPYRPGEEPVDGKCPVCDKDMESIAKRSRISHIHGCRRQEVAKARGHKPRDLRYCYDCFEWFVVGSGEWNRHCNEFHSCLAARSCNRVTYNNNTVKEYRCGGCADPHIPEELRFKDYSPNKFWVHMQNHIDEIQAWPARCIYSLCKHLIPDAEALEYHLRDFHYLSKRQSCARAAGKKRRRNDNDDEHSSPD